MAGVGEELDIDKMKHYAANASRVGSAIEALKRHDGWQIFLGLFQRRKREIQDRSDYPDDLQGLAQFKGDRKAVDLIEGIFAEMDGFVEDANSAQEALRGISTEPEKPRGIMLIEAMEESGRDS